MTRDRFRRQLQELQEQVLKMGSMVEEAIDQAIRSLLQQDLELARAVIEQDDRIDDLEMAIEEDGLHLIALQQPLASDLRTISTILKTITDLERMADYATNIAERTLWIGTAPLVKPLPAIPKMAALAQQMVRQSLDAFARRDAELAAQVCHADDPVDELYVQVFEALMELIGQGGGGPATSQGVQLLFAARYLERIADHATNIAERVIYMATGRRVAHQLKTERRRIQESLP